ncbi:hypothetical protein C8Q80DRAFT_382480 [Daedaleopsis nitida]|nr:hypothetical protein C8Q80DRAFT_382480 [Daedaleopsis nitida]
MTKKRRSLSSIFVPPFMPQASPAATASTSSTSVLSPSAPTSPTRSVHSQTITYASSSDLAAIENSSDWLSFYSGATSPPSDFSSLGPVAPSRNSPPPDLLDEDPFANLSPAPSVRALRATSPVRSAFDVFSDDVPPVPPTPLSPLTQSALALEQGDESAARRARNLRLRNAPSFKSLRELPSTPPPSPKESARPHPSRRTKSSGPPQVRPAYTRPAFAPRPSLPSLNTLATASVLVPQVKVRRGLPGAQLPLEPWEDQDSAALSAPPSPTYTRMFTTSPMVRRRHARRPTLSMIRDSRMYFDGDGESAEDGGIAPLQAPDAGSVGDAREGAPSGAASISLEPDGEGSMDSPDEDSPPTPPPKSPLLACHARSTSGTSTTSTVPSLCPSSPTSSYSASTDPVFHPHSPPQSPIPHPHVLLDADPGYSGLFAHNRNTQHFTSDLLATLEYDYAEALSHLGTPGRTSALFPSADFEPGSSAGTIKNVVLARVQSQDSDESSSQEDSIRRTSSESSGESQWTPATSDAHGQSGLFQVPLSLAELHALGSEDLSAESSTCPSPLFLSRSSIASSAVSSEYDFTEEEEGYYSYDVGPFRDPLGTPSSAQQRPVLGYGIPWPSTRRTSGGSGGSGESVSDVLSDLEDLAEDLTERFALSLRSSDELVRSPSSCGAEDVFGGGELTDAPEGGYSSTRSGRPSGGSSHGQHAAGGSSNGRSGSAYSRGGNGYGGYRRGGADDDEDSDDERRRRPTRLPISSHGAAPDSDSESEGSEDDDDPANMKKTRHRHDTTRPGMRSSPPPTSRPADTTDDDVPLAQQIPGALRAQRTIRRQVRDELDQKRAERRAQRAQARQEGGEQRPTRALSSAADNAKAALSSSPSKPVGRPRTKTLPGNMNGPFSAGDLTQKLLGLQATSSAGPSSSAIPPMPVSPLAPRSKRPSFDGPQDSLARGRSITGEPQSCTGHGEDSASHTLVPPSA